MTDKELAPIFILPYSVHERLKGDAAVHLMVWRRVCPPADGPEGGVPISSGQVPMPLHPIDPPPRRRPRVGRNMRFRYGTLALGRGFHVYFILSREIC